jgi:C1A family cysteine protease
MTNGPLMVGLSVYEGFETYDGTYIYNTTSLTTTFLGRHAIKLIGWYTHPTLGLYWICQNQWGTTWGQNGFLMIQSGLIGLDSMGVGCLPDLQ